MSLHSDDYAIYLPAVNGNYAEDVRKPLEPNRPFPEGLELKDLAFWESDALWHYPYILHSAGLFRIGDVPINGVTARTRSTSILLGDSGGFQIGCGTMKGLKVLHAAAMSADDAELGWMQEYEAREWIVTWLCDHANYAMTIDIPLWARSKARENTPFHNCTPQQLINMTVSNLKFIESRAHGDTKWLNVVQGAESIADIKLWWDAVKWYRKGGWAMAGTAGAVGGLANMLSTLLMMRDDGAFEAGQDWVHVLGVSTPTWAIVLSAIQRALRTINPALRVSFDSSSPFQIAGRYEEVTLTPEFTNVAKTWSLRTVKAPQSRLYVDPMSTKPFEHSQSPLGRLLLLNHLNVRDGKWEPRPFDGVSNLLLANHVIWVYLDAMKTANDLVAAKDATRVPKRYLDCVDFIQDVFKRPDWTAAIAANKPLLDAMAPNRYKGLEDAEKAKAA